MRGFFALGLVISLVGCSTDSTVEPTDEPDVVDPVDIGDGDNDTGPTTDVDAPIDIDQDVEGPVDTDDDAGVEDAVEDTSDDVGPDDVDPGDTGPEDGGVEDTEDIVDPPIEPDYVTCDAGHEAWVKRTLPVILGRNPHGIREVRVLADMAAQTSRAAVARGLMNGPEYLDRWAQWLKDEVRVNRVGDKMHPTCYGSPNQPEDNGDIAAFIRDNAPDTNDTVGVSIHMGDVLYSSLKLDDLSPFYRGHIFAMMPKPITGANVAALELDLTRRQDFGENFEAVFLHRNVVCAGCHNAEYATTDSPDPELDRHWPIAGKFEKGIYGSSYGIQEMNLYSTFRHLGVVRSNGGVRPWNLNSACGRFEPRGSIDDDPAEVEAFFTKELGQTGSVWDVEETLRQGIDSLRENGVLTVDPETFDVSGPESFAYLLSMRIVNRVWREVMGYPLTLVHYFPRNEFQRDTLMQLTQHFVMEEWSLKTLLTDIVTNPLYNDNAAIDGCGDTAYSFPAVFNPWVRNELEDELHGNSVGDQTHRYNARVLLRILNTAMEWPQSPDFPNGQQESFQKAVGVFVKDAEPGFDGVDFQGMLTWENRYGACESQGSTGTGDAGSCAGFCGGEAVGCFCDDECVGADDCCEDYTAICIDGETPGPSSNDDWIGKLVTAAKLNMTEDVDDPTNITVADVVSSLKNRLLTQPDIDEADEAELIAALFEVDDLNAPLVNALGWEETLRRLCGVLVSTPQFMLVGNPQATQEQVPRLVLNGSYETIC
ncbi:MAG: hypothetical protein ACI9OJ_005064, partial [Myxococcota bacterium]